MMAPLSAVDLPSAELTLGARLSYPQVGTICHVRPKRVFVRPNMREPNN